MLFQKRRPNAEKGKILDFQKLTLQLSGMRFSEIYEIVPEENSATLSLYTPDYRAKEREARTLLKETACDKREVLDLLNACKVANWDGFYGAHPKRVKDGTMFHFTLDLGEGCVLSATGSENFPKHFHEFTSGIRALEARETASEKDNT